MMASHDYVIDKESTGSWAIKFLPRRADTR